MVSITMVQFVIRHCSVTVLAMLQCIQPLDGQIVDEDGCNDFESYYDGLYNECRNCSEVCQPCNQENNVKFCTINCPDYHRTNCPPVSTDRQKYTGSFLTTSIILNSLKRDDGAGSSAYFPTPLDWPGPRVGGARGDPSLALTQSPSYTNSHTYRDDREKSNSPNLSPTQGASIDNYSEYSVHSPWPLVIVLCSILTLLAVIVFIVGLVFVVHRLHPRYCGTSGASMISPQYSRSVNSMSGQSACMHCGQDVKYIPLNIDETSTILPSNSLQSNLLGSGWSSTS